MVRVIAGEAKGRNLFSVPGEGTRPITDRVKEALFNILRPQILSSTWLDLFAGTGSVGIEALSRGAAHVVFVDNAGQAIKTVKRNLELTGFADKAEVIRDDAMHYLQQIEVGAVFDYIYVAPPQYRELWAQTLTILDQRTFLEPEGLVIVQIHPRELAPITLNRLELLSERRYGSTLLLFYGERSIPEEIEDDASSS